LHQFSIGLRIIHFEQTNRMLGLRTGHRQPGDLLKKAVSLPGWWGDHPGTDAIAQGTRHQETSFWEENQPVID